MALSKTEHGRNALKAQTAAGLSLSERRVLILSDGRRSRNDIVALLGTDALPMIERLLQAGYLSIQGETSATARPATSGNRTTVKPQSPIISTPATQTQTPRRSLAVSRIYLADMLQVHRDPRSVALRAQIQTSPDEGELVHHMMDGLRHLQEVATAGYARRVGDRLAEILPEPYLPRLQHVRTSRLESSSTSAVA